MESIRLLITKTVHDLYSQEVVVTLDRPDAKFGDAATNVAMQLVRTVGKNPREIAETIAAALREHEDFTEVTVAGPGFINLRLTDAKLLDLCAQEAPKLLAGKQVVAEYSDPNPFKVLHAGHLYTTIVGDAIARLAERAGATVHRVNFGGDVGPHVAMNMWAIIQTLGGENPEKLSSIDTDLHARAAWLAARYVEGHAAYESDEQAKADILAINKRIYALHSDHDTTTPFAQIYWQCRQWSYDYFALLYDELGVVQFEKYYPESMTTPTGVATVRRELERGVYTESDGAIVFRGEDYGLHTRVFINSQGLPTYEAKDVGLIMQKWADYHFDLSLIITGNDIVEYMKVVQKSIEQFEPELVQRSRHLVHGNLKLSGGRKMSSRKGQVLLALDVLQAARDAQQAQHDAPDERVVLGAVKYAFLQNRIGGDIIYDPETSVSLTGNSGPYLQYAHARAQSILNKSTATPLWPMDYALDSAERQLTRKLSEYSDVVAHATSEYAPHYVCTYLFELSQEFNRFYEKSHVIGDEREVVRIWLVTKYRDTLADGLGILGIAAPERL